MAQFRGASDSFLVVPAGPSDAEALARVHVAAWRETYRGLLPDGFLARMSEAAHARRFRRELLNPGPEDITLALIDREGIVGYASGGASRSGEPDEAEIATLYLLRHVQARGLGALLMTQMARAFASRGSTSLLISVLRENVHARSFYSHLGGEADPARQERGPGGQVLYEVAYRWPDIGVLSRRS